MKAQPRFPIATYRLQFNREFTFRDATNLYRTSLNLESVIVMLLPICERVRAVCTDMTSSTTTR
jgi:maltooligosyltrehalose synthase